MIVKDKTSMFSPGDRVVHSGHGIGQIVAIEEKSFGGKETVYYRIETDDIVIWVPVEEEGDLLRQITSPEDFAQAVSVLQRPSEKMSSIFQSRLARIRQAQAKGTPRALARIIRDLWARQERRGQLSSTETQALRKLMDQLLAEWSVSTGMDESQTSKKLFSMLRQHALPAVQS